MWLTLGEPRLLPQWGSMKIQSQEEPRLAGLNLMVVFKSKAGSGDSWRCCLQTVGLSFGSLLCNTPATRQSQLINVVVDCWLIGRRRRLLGSYCRSRSSSRTPVGGKKSFIGVQVCHFKHLLITADSW